MTSQASLLTGGKSGAAIVLGQPEQSLLVKAIRHEHERLKMPPSGGKLADAEIAAIEQWIRDGAVWPVSNVSVVKAKEITPEQRAFWSFQPVKAPRAGATIDSLVKPGARADARTLIRRVTFDLTGLPPTADEVEAFLRDKSPEAFAKVVDRLLASRHYGEQWGRHWLDVARYSDDKLHPERDEPRPNAFRYRDWVIGALNSDMPYDEFVRAHVAGDAMGEKHVAALGMYAMSPEFQEDRVDVTTRGFLGLTVACAQCHDHKFDPIPQRDYYSLLGVFDNTEEFEYPLAGKDVVDLYKSRKEVVEKAEAALKEFVDAQGNLVAETFARRAAEYWKGGEGLDAAVAERWKKFVEKKREHKFYEEAKSPEEFQALLLAVYQEKKEVDEKNLITLGGSKKRGDLAAANLVSLERNRYFLWRDFFGNGGVFLYGEKDLGRYLGPVLAAHLEKLQGEVAAAKKNLPEQYPFYYSLKDKKELAKPRIHLRGNKATPGEVVDSTFLTILGAKALGEGSGRWGLAAALVAPENPLTARVLVNRVWAWRFGEGIVRTASNFGQLGERPASPELLDLLAWRFVHEHKWSLKALHREMVLSRAYQAAEFPKRRLEAEPLRDAILAASGLLDRTAGGVAAKLDEKNRRRTVYGFVSRRKLDPMLALFDFPSPMETCERRMETNVPLQRLFLLNSPVVLEAAKHLAGEVKTVDEAYRRLFARGATAAERKAGEEFVAGGAWAEYLQTLMATDEFLYVQ